MFDIFLHDVPNVDVDVQLSKFPKPLLPKFIESAHISAAKEAIEL